MADWVLGVDFGTSNTTAAIWVEGQPGPRVVRLSDEGDQMPSAVLVDGATTYVGQAAVRQAYATPQLYLANPKNHLGEGSWQFGGRVVDVVDLVAAVLRRVVERARAAAGGGDPSLVVLTCPEQWQDYRRSQLEAAARAAVGQVPTQVVSEPVAAATLYGLDRPDAGRVGVIDLGGGTSDVAVLDADGSGGLTVLAAGGDDMGGNHIDAALIRFVLDELRTQGHGDIADALLAERAGPAMLSLREQVRGAKHHLAEYEHATVRVQTDAGSASVTITDDRLRELSAPMGERVVALVREVAERAGVEVGGLDEAYLTGGSSRLRVVHERLTDLLGRPPLLRHDPKTVVALGALHHAAAARRSPAATGGRRTDGAEPVAGEQPAAVREPAPVQASPRVAAARPAEPTPAAPGRRRLPLPLPVLVAIPLVLALVVGLFVWRPWDPVAKPTRPGSTPTPVGSASPVPADTPEAPTAEQRADRDKLVALVGRDPKGCEFDTPSESAGELAKLSCYDDTVKIGTTTGWAIYTLYRDEATAKDLAGSLGVSADRRCPEEGFGPYESEGRRGLVACVASGVHWVQDGIPVRAKFGIDDAVPTADLFAFWQGHNRLG